MKKTSIISGFLVLAIVASLFLMWRGVAGNDKESSEEQQLYRMEQATNYIATGLQTQLNNSESALNALAQELMVQASAGMSFTDADTLRMTDTVLKTYGFESVAVCDAKGHAYEAGTEGFDVTEDDAYQKALAGKPVLSFQKYSSTAREEAVVFHVPLIVAGKTEAVIRAAWSSATLESCVFVSDFRRKENVFLINQSSLILYSTQNKFISDAMFLSLWGERDEQFREVEQVIKQGRSTSLFMQDKDGREYCIAYQGLQGISDWGVAVVIYANDLQTVLDASPMAGKVLVYALLAVACVIALFVILLYQSHKHYYLDRLAYIDGVTKSYNFKGFMMRVQKQFQNDPTAKCAILEVTLDKFDYYTELFGEEARNQLLREFSTLISHWSHADEAHCRYNTTNFVVFIKYQNMDELRDRIIYLKDKVADFEKGETQRERFEYECLVGVVCIEGEERDIDTLLRRADAALLAAKGDKRAPFAVYNARMENSKSEDREYEARMDQALREKEFLVYLQPKFSLIDGRQVGAEALVRWMHPEKGLLYPGRFIALFEKNGFITELDIYILENICQRLAAWIHRGIQPHPISFNVSLHNLYKENFVDQAAEIVERYGVPAKLIIFEVSEGAIVENIKLMQETMERLKNRGFMISMDDFGRGTVSLNTLYQVPVDELKIERRFLLETAESSRGQSIINSIIDTSKRLGIHVVAEGVDNKQQAGMLRDLGCDMMQGFVFSEPLPEQEYDDYAYGPLSGENYISL